MERTITAIYDKGILIPLVGKLPRKRSKVKITILEEIENEKEGISVDDLKRIHGKLTSFPSDSIKYQRELRDEW